MFTIDTIIISITDACPLSCFGCYATKDMPRMSYENFVKIIDKLPIAKSITLTGGEPFSNPDMPKMIRYCAETKMKPRIVTSGYMPIRMLAEISDHLELLTVTIKYLNDPSDAAWRKGKDTFKKSKESLVEGKRLGIPLSINWIADKQNVSQFYLMQQFASQVGASLQVVRFIPYADHLKVFALTDAVWEDLCEHATRFSNVHIGFPSEVAAKKNVGYIYCTGGINRIYIRTDGSVTPCIYLSEAIGNIFEDSFEAIEQKGFNWRILNKSLDGKKIKGCIGYLKEMDPKYKNMVFDQQNVMEVMQRMGGN